MEVSLREALETDLLHASLQEPLEASHDDDESSESTGGGQESSEPTGCGEESLVPTGGDGENLVLEVVC